MSKCLIVYFSQGGTTARIAESIASGLCDNGEHTVDLYTLKEIPPPVEGYDLLGVGFPVYMFRPPFTVMDYLRSLPELAGLPVFTFIMYGTYRGDAANMARRVLMDKGGREIGYFCARGSDQFLGYLKQGYLFSPDSPKEDKIEEAKRFGRKMGIRLGQREDYQIEIDQPPSWAYRLERLLTNRWLARNFYSRFFRVKRNECTSCGLCVKICPTSNIAADAKGQPGWGRECLLCLYCEMKCPEEAIMSPVSWPIFEPFMRYNVKQASRDPRIDHVHVIHARGRVSRLA